MRAGVQHVCPLPEPPNPRAPHPRALSGHSLSAPVLVRTKIEAVELSSSHRLGSTRQFADRSVAALLERLRRHVGAIVGCTRGNPIHGWTTEPDGVNCVRGLAVTNTVIAHRTARSGVVRVEASLGDFEFPAHSHDHLCIGIVRSGEHDCRYGLRRYTVAQGDLMLVNAGEVHDGHPSGWCGRSYTMLEVDPEAFRSLCRDALASEWIEFEHAVVRDPRASTALSAWVDALGSTDPLAERDAAAMVFGCLLEHGDPGPRLAARNDLTARVVRRMREDYADADGIGEIAAETGVSRYTLIRAFKRRLGLSPEDVRRQLRVERALCWPGQPLSSNQAGDDPRNCANCRNLPYCRARSRWPDHQGW